MLAGRIRAKLALFVVIAVAAVTYAGGKYAGLDRLFGSRGYLVGMQLTDSGGIFTNAEVTYRGVTVGRVAQLHLNDAGVLVDLDIDPDAEPIPADVRAVVAARSAIGEQYVDLRPQRDGAPYLTDGSLITVERTAVPPAAENVLANLDGLVNSVPLDALRTVVDEMDRAFTGTGPQLQRLLDSVGSLTTTATEHLPQTVGLIEDGRVVLARQQADATKLATFSAGLRQITEQLRESDPDLRKLIGVTPEVGRQVMDILRTSGNDFGVVMANLLTTTQITSSRTGAIEEFLVALPVISAFTPSTAPDGTGHLGIMLNFFDPPPCLKGYEGTKERTASDIGPIPTNRDAYCAEPSNSPIGVRGAHNAPFGGVPKQVPSDGGQNVSGQPGSGQRGPVKSRLPGALGLSDTGAGLTGFGQLLGLTG